MNENNILGFDPSELKAEYTIQILNHVYHFDDYELMLLYKEAIQTEINEWMSNNYNYDWYENYTICFYEIIWYNEEPKRLPKKLNDTCIDGYVDIYVNSSVINSNPKFIELFYTDIDCMLYILKSKQMIKTKSTNKSLFYN